ncbi:helix-turn-helix transcriptional regulator [Cupriavidus gilardii]|uniref:helix-turn-helix transcriptional regulator n=1 Tax=Cupriavidus gilardii TaxID=82541 RepID=UPI0021B31EA9|nr:AlpA family transcriptional regulator [Cupriavidus gilardii]UXC37331.1 AlpA family transcriptional regulator [Cupriavidus gilardii]
MADNIDPKLTILRRREVQSLTGLSRSTIYKRIQERTFPQPIKLGGHAVGWRAGDIEAWLQDPSSYRSP